MPPLPAVPNVLKVVIQCQGNDGRIAENVLHMTYGGSPPSYTDAYNIAALFFQGWQFNFTPTQPAQTSLVQVTVTDLSSDTGAEAVYNNSDTPIPGSSTHGMLPLHTCFLLSKFVIRRYRGGHPRSYLPIGTTNDLNDDGDWKTSSFNPWVTAWATMLGVVIGGNPFGGTSVGQECAVSYVSKEVNPVPPYRRPVPLVLDIPIDGYTGSEKLATQRRRVRRYR